MHPFDNFKSNRYWNSTPERVSQKFYVALCLYTSGILDYAIGMDLKDESKLNWSTTASYYSMIHNARMIVFISVGDYSTRHGDMGQFFYKNKPLLLKQGTETERKGFNNAWFNNFISDFNDSIDCEPACFTLNDLAHHYRERLNVQNSEDLFRTVGNIFENAKALREDSNYEALLIAHEYQHPTVTVCFEELSQKMSEGAKAILNVATKCFQNFVENDENLQSERLGFKYFLKKFIKERIYGSIHDRITSEDILEQIKKICNPLEKMLQEQQSEPNREYIQRLDQRIEEWVSIDVFGSKARLMGNFRNKIEDLNKNINLANRGSFCKI